MELDPTGDLLYLLTVELGPPGEGEGERELEVREIEVRELEVREIEEGMQSERGKIKRERERGVARALTVKVASRFRIHHPLQPPAPPE